MCFSWSGLVRTSTAPYSKHVWTSSGWLERPFDEAVGMSVPPTAPSSGEPSIPCNVWLITGIGTTSFINLCMSASATILCSNLKPYSSTSDICASGSSFSRGPLECGDGDLDRGFRSGNRSSNGMSINMIVGVWSSVFEWYRSDRAERHDVLVAQTWTVARSDIGIYTHSGRRTVTKGIS